MFLCKKYLRAIDNLYVRCMDGPKINHNSDLKPLASSKAEDIDAKSNEVVEKLKIIKAYLNDFKIIVQSADQKIAQKSKTLMNSYKN